MTRDRDPNPQGEVTRIRTRVQAAFRPSKLMIARAPEDAVILDILIANQSQLVGDDGVPASVFSPSAMGIQLELATAQTGQEVAVDVRTILGGAFSAVLMGTLANGQQYTLPLLGTLAGVDLLVEEAKKAIKWHAAKKGAKKTGSKKKAKRAAGKIRRDTKGDLIDES